MNLSSHGLALLMDFEGLKTTAYQCDAHVWTIGYGHTEGVKPGDTMTEKEAENTLKKDVVFFEKKLNGYLAEVQVNQNQFDALLCLIFNIGPGNFGDSTLLKKLKKGDFTAAAEHFLDWKYARGKINKGLINRRQRERALFLEEITPEAGAQD